MDSAAIVRGLRQLPEYQGQIVHLEIIPGREARYSELRDEFHPALQEALKELGMLPLFRHQARAISAIRDGAQVIVSTPAASGKSLVYNATVVDCLLREKDSSALYIFPTKALAQDQWRALRELLDSGPRLRRIRVSTFDGDTPLDERGEIRRSAQVLLTNPDMLHYGILPNHRSWLRFLRRLKYVVIDEAHIYRGVFGSQVANVLRRLRRLCKLHGASPQFILSSATIANPGEHARALVGKPFTVVAEDGSPSSEKVFLFWNPPIIDEARSARRSPNTEASILFTRLVSQEIRTLTFARTRRVAELIYMYSRGQLELARPDLAGRIMPYRAGYLAEDRRRIEQDFATGRLLGVCATNALELGIDIGELDATVLTGYPGTIASAWQQAGRSGRRGEPSISVMVGRANPLDQYFMRHPLEFFGKPHEHALISPSNPYIMRPHLLCAAYEWPLSSADKALFGDDCVGHLEEMEEQGHLKFNRGRWHLSTEVTYPAEMINIRSASSDNYVIVVKGTGALLETIEGDTAFYQVHRGAVYLYQGDPYLITDLDIEARIAYATPTEVKYYTQTNDITDIRILQVRRQREVGAVTACEGWIEVSDTVLGYRRKARVTEEVLSEEALDLPPQVYRTSALWFDIPASAVDRILKDYSDFPGGLHAAEHAAISILPMFAMCDRADIGGLSTVRHPDTGKAQVFIYDGHPGGIGIAEKGFDVLEELWSATLKTLQECPCKAGCPSCIQSPKCGSNNEPLDKAAARIILEELLKCGGQRTV